MKTTLIKQTATTAHYNVDITEDVDRIVSCYKDLELDPETLEDKLYQEFSILFDGQYYDGKSKMIDKLIAIATERIQGK